MLGRDTEWRQGALLSGAGAHALGLIEAPASEKRVVVISHDCDLAHNEEAFVEVIVGSLIPRAEANYTSAKNPRRLHLTFESEASDPLHVELRHADRQQVAKGQFAAHSITEEHAKLPPDEKRALKQWLAARYGRPAFPNAFENRLRKQIGKRSVERLIDKIVEPASQHLVALFFDLGEERNVELPEGEPYFLSITVAYDASEGGLAARETADKVAAELRGIFLQAYGTADEAVDIALENCRAVADTFMTLADVRRVDQWRLEYVSLREDPVGEFLPTGNLPV